MEGIRHRFDFRIADRLSGLRSSALLLSDDKTAADGKEYPLQEERAVTIECRKTHAVRVRRGTGHRIHLIAMRNQVPALIEGDGMVTRQFQGSLSSNNRELSIDLRRIDAFRGLTGQAQQDGAVGTVSQTG